MTSFYTIPFWQGIPNCIHPIHASLYPSFVLLEKKNNLFNTKKPAERKEGNIIQSLFGRRPLQRDRGSLNQSSNVALGKVHKLSAVPAPCVSNTSVTAIFLFYLENKYISPTPFETSGISNLGAESYLPSHVLC